MSRRIHPNRQPTIDESCETSPASPEGWQELIQAAPVHLCLLDGDGTIRFANRALPGLDDQCKPGANVFRLLGEGAAPLRAAITQAQASGKSVRYQLNGPGAGGLPAVYEGRVAPVRRAGAPERFAVSAMDVSVLKQAQESMARRAEELERSNGDLENFAFAASHELRQPLSVLLGYLDLLKPAVQEDSPRSFLLEMEAAARRMDELVTGLLELARVGHRGRPLVATSADEALAAAMANLRLVLHDSGAHVEAAGLPVVKADAVQLTQVFQNLIANGVKFQGELPPEVHITARPHGQQIEFVVRDNGIGIDDAGRAKLFTVFQRLQGDRYPGTGIGLALCKRIVERHGGAIWVDSNPGQGSSFHFTMPAEAAA